MADPGFRLILYPAVINTMMREYADASAYRGALAVQRRAQQNVTAAGRVHTGGMRNSIRARRVRADGDGALWEVGSNRKHTIFQEKGTRAHGPVTAKFLVFTPKGSGTVVFAKWVRGVKAAHFLRDAINSATVSDFLP